MKLFALAVNISFLGDALEEKMLTIPLYCAAQSQNEAIGAGYEWLAKHYPKDKGYFDFQCSAAEIPQVYLNGMGFVQVLQNQN